MHIGRTLAIGTRLGLAVLALAWIACGGSATDVDEAAEQQNEEWTWLQQTKSDLDAKRQELAGLRALIAGEVEPPADAPEQTEEELAQAQASLESDIVGAADQFMGRLVGFINDQGITVGGTLTDIQTAAIRMKSSEEIHVAREYIERGGDYSKAIDIYKAALAFDADNPDLAAALAEAEVLQYMTEDRFGAVKKKMTQAQVRSTIGQVNLHNVKEYEERGTVAWFYRKEDGGAAGVYFKEAKKDDGNWLVYATDFDAVKPPSSEG